MGLYTEKIAQNQMKIDKLNELIKKHTEKRKQLVDENARLSYLTLCAEYRCEGQELLEIIQREHEQSESTAAGSDSNSKIKSSDYLVADIDDETKSEPEYIDQLSFT